MIAKWYEIICDHCGWAEHFQGSIHSAERCYRENGGIVTKDKNHYCDKDCYTKGEGEKKNKVIKKERE